MKRLLVILLAGALLCAISGCREANHDSAKGNPVVLSMQTGQTYSNYDGIRVQISDGTWNEKGFVLKVDWTNQTSREAIFGASYSIERKEGEAWVSCATVDDLVFDTLAYILSPNQTRTETYAVSGMFDVSKPGIYRFHSFCSVESRDDTELWAEFSLCEDENGNQTGTQPIREYGTQYIRTNGCRDGIQFPQVQIIGSLQDLEDYYNAYSESFDLERKEKVYSDTTIGFLNACDRYDAAFFENNFLIFVLLEEGSGSVRHAVQSVEQTAEKKISVSIGREVPEVCTSDMAQWHIILELNRDVKVETPGDVLVYLDGSLAWNGSAAEPPKQAAAFKEPPAVTLSTPEGSVSLKLAGYSWFVEHTDGTTTAAIAEQAGRPVAKECLNPVAVSSKYAETVYVPVPGSDIYAPTNSLGYLVKLHWEANPDSVTYTCWPDTVWQNSNIPEETVASQEFAFYAKPGGYIYEITATWENVGYSGTANYYVYIVDTENEQAETANCA